MRNALIFVLTIFLIGSSPAFSAAPDTKLFIRLIETGPKETREGLLAMLYGIGQGLTTYNGWNQVHNGVQAFCPPENLLIVHEQYLFILKEHVRKYPSYAKKPMQMTLLDGLQKTFPCK